MAIEDDIQQNNFRSSHHKLAINLYYTSNWLLHKHEGFFRDEDITLQQFNVLRILRGQYPQFSNLKLVKERMIDRMSDASRITDKLVAKGLVERHSCKNDRRQVDLIISKKGLALLKRLDFIDSEFQKIMSKLSKDEVESLNKLLDKMRS